MKGWLLKLSRDNYEWKLWGEIITGNYELVYQSRGKYDIYRLLFKVIIQFSKLMFKLLLFVQNRIWIHMIIKNISLFYWIVLIMCHNNWRILFSETLLQLQVDPDPNELYLLVDKLRRFRIPDYIYYIYINIQLKYNYNVNYIFIFLNDIINDCNNKSF